MFTPRRKRQGRQMQAALAPVIKADRKAAKSRSRYAAERYLREVLRLYEIWKRRGFAKRYSTRAARYAAVSVGANMHPLRRIIEATTQEPDRKKRSRWTRALQFAVMQKSDSTSLRKL